MPALNRNPEVRGYRTLNGVLGTRGRRCAEAFIEAELEEMRSRMRSQTVVINRAVTCKGCREARPEFRTIACHHAGKINDVGCHFIRSKLPNGSIPTCHSPRNRWRWVWLSFVSP